MDKRIPLNAVIFSFLMPGMGQLYIHRIVTAGFILLWWIIICYNSKFLPAIHYSLLGQIEQAKLVIDVQWLLNIPSVFLFSVYDAYVNTVENNNLYEWEQAKFLKRQYQYEKFQMPAAGGKHRSEAMYLIATFEYNQFLERAITGMQMKGIAKERILAAPLDKRGEDRQILDTMHSSDGLSLIDLAAILGTIFMLLGAIYGFILAWGPIWWGLIGLVFGAIMGFFIKLIATKKYARTRRQDDKAAEVVLIIECKDHEIEVVRNVLWDNHALGVSKLDIASKL